MTGRGIERDHGPGLRREAGRIEDACIGRRVGDVDRCRRQSAHRLLDRSDEVVGIDNLNNDKYFLFHPFPQRTVVAELKFAL